MIYFVQNHEKYSPSLAPVFAALDAGEIEAVVSPVTLAECLVHPARLKRPELEAAFRAGLLHGPGMSFQDIDPHVAITAARIRAEYNVSLLDAFQLGAAQASGCRALLTNDLALKRFGGLEIVILDEHLP
ncbi:MAG: hypothetical protein AMXMBFR47_26100 [Planctomycetota bacterium]